MSTLRPIGAAVALLIALAVAPLSAAADEQGTDCRLTSRFTAECDITATDPEAKPTTRPVDSTPGDTGDGSACFVRRPNWIPLNGELGDPVPCESGGGVFSNELGCYLRLVEPQPPAGDPAWEGHDPAEGGAVYDCVSPLTTALNRRLWLAAPPEPPIAPGEVARQAVAQMGLRAIEIGLAPEPGGIGLVGMPVWLWAATPDGPTFGPTTASATAGGVTVTATARVDHIVWDLGDGSSVTCTTAGTPYEARYGRAASPDCGHTYLRESADQPGDAYTVTATSYWVVTWEGAGQTGNFSLDGLTSQAQVVIAEAQVLTS